LCLLVLLYFLRAESADLLNDTCLEAKFSECLEQCKGFVQKSLVNQVVVFSSNSFGYGSFLHRYQSLASGNVVICKPSKSFSMSMQHEVYCYDRAGFPPGVISLLHGCAVDDNI
jgi:delta 1-pyrroline-5-carboxylate dehydrogenase